jgi:hypothetical protein
LAERPDEPLVLCIWADAWSTPQVESANELKPAFTCISVGFLLREGKVISLAQTRDVDEGWRDVLNIPKKYVVSIEPV